MVTDAKFYKPGDSSTAYSVTAENMHLDVNALHDLAFKTATGWRLTHVATDAMLGGRFVLDDPRDEMIAQQEKEIGQLRAGAGNVEQVIQKAAMEKATQHQMKRKDSMKSPDEKKLETFFEEFWMPFNKQLSQTLGIGCGFMIYTRPGEDKKFLKNKVYFPRECDYDAAAMMEAAPDRASENRRPAGSDKPKIRWVAPETKNFLRGTVIDDAPHIDILDWARDWQWWNIPVHKSRLHPLCLNTSEDKWYGIGDVEPCKAALYALYNLDLGVLDRIGAWALRLLIFRIDFQKALGAKKSQLDELALSMGHENYKLLDKAEDLVQLNDKVGMGIELRDLALGSVSIATGYPTIYLLGNSEGAITGSEVDLTQVQLVLSNKQTKLNPYLKDIMLNYYNIDADELFWKMSIFTTAQAIQGQGPNNFKPATKPGNGNPFGGGLKTPKRPELGMKTNLTDKTPGDD